MTMCTQVEDNEKNVKVNMFLKELLKKRGEIDPTPITEDLSFFFLDVCLHIFWGGRTPS